MVIALPIESMNWMKQSKRNNVIAAYINLLAGFISMSTVVLQKAGIFSMMLAAALRGIVKNSSALNGYL